MKTDKIINDILENYSVLDDISQIDMDKQPDKDIILDILSRIRDILFPGFFGRKNLTKDTIEYYLGDQLQIIHDTLKEQILLAFAYGTEYKSKSIEEKKDLAEYIINSFLSTLPKIREYLATDVDATFDGDPAAFSKAEIIFSYPGFYAITVNRIAHELYELKVPLIPRIMTEHAHSLTGIDIHPGATLGKYLMIDHGTGIVIGETTFIGEHVKIYQGVTLGALSTQGGQSLKNKKRHPTIEDNVTIYSNASVLGGDTVIGEGTTIGGSAFITKSVPPYTTVNIKAELKFKISDRCEEF